MSTEMEIPHFEQSAGPSAPHRAEKSRGHKCNSCSKVFRRKQNMTAHFRLMHRGAKELTCDLCGKLFALKGNLTKHRRAVHDKIRNYSCDQCGKLFSQRGNLRGHMKSVHDKSKDYFCHVCGEGYSMKGSLAKHMNRVHKNKAQGSSAESDQNVIKPAETSLARECSEGLLETLKEGKEDLNIEDHDEEPESEESNPSVEPESESMSQAISEHRISKPHKCSLCPKEFKGRWNLSVHIKTVHDKIKDYRCDVCDKLFTFKGNLDKHKRAVHKAKICPPKPLVDDTSIHERRYDDDLALTLNEIKEYNAGEDNVSIKPDPEEQKSKRRRKGAKKVYKCDKCDKEFKRGFNLSSHIKIVHNKIKDYQCELCDRLFALNGNLKKHMRAVHSRIKTQLCNLCGKYFKQKGALLAHKKAVHDKVKDQICPVCDRGFSAKGVLNRHILRKHHHTIRVNTESDWSRMPQPEEKDPLEIIEIKSEVDDDPVDMTHFLQNITEMVYKEEVQDTQSDMGEDITERDEVTQKDTNDLNIEAHDEEPESEECNPSVEPESEPVPHAISARRVLKSYKCSLCSKEFKGGWNLSVHIKTVHDKIKEYQCDVCDKLFAFKGNLEKHKRAVHNKIKTHLCNLCGLCFHQKHGLLAHKKAVHDKVKDQVCPVCNRGFSAKGDLNRHMHRMHRQTISMNIESDKSRIPQPENKNPEEGFGEVDEDALDVNKRLNNDDELVQKGEVKDTQPDTGEDLKKQDEVTQDNIHIDANDEEPRNQKCNPKARPEGEPVPQAVSAARVSKPYQCSLCPKEFNGKWNFLSHIKIVHDKIRDYKCDLCERLFSLKGNLTKHKLAVHDKIKKHSCDSCGKSFSQSRSLLMHKLAAHKELSSPSLAEANHALLLSMRARPKPIECPICHKILAHSKNLKEHIRAIHEKIKEHKCEHCDKRFAFKSNWTKHRKAGNCRETWDQGKDLCGTCEESFPSLQGLAEHMEKSHG